MIPTRQVVRRRTGAVVTIDDRQWDAEKYTTHGVEKAKRRQAVRSAPRHLGEPAEFTRIG